MRLFLSWSGPTSRHVAALLCEWIPDVLGERVEPWMSDNDIASGDRWATSIGEALKNHDFGIVCLSAENLGSQWLLFEAGALSKSFGASGVVPYLIGGLLPSQVTGPLAQFQARVADKEGTLALAADLNRQLDPQIADDRLQRRFKAHWPAMESGLQRLPAADSSSATAAVRPPEELLDEILTTVRRIERDSEAEAGGLEALPRGLAQVVLGVHGDQEDLQRFLGAVSDLDWVRNVRRLKSRGHEHDLFIQFEGGDSFDDRQERRASLNHLAEASGLSSILF